MKKAVSILSFLLFLNNILVAANSTPFHLKFDSLPYQLNKIYWKYNQDDSVVFNTPNYNDHHWQLVNPNMHLDRTNKIKFKGFAWFRLTLLVDSDMVNKPLAIAMNHYGASEIFLNGFKVVDYGEINTADEIVYYNPQELPFVLVFKNIGKQVLAIRYANYNAQRNYDDYDEPMAGFQIKIGKANNMIKTKNVNAIALSSIFMMLTGFFFSFCVIHFFMYMLNRGIRSNLYFSIFMLSLTLVFVIGLLSFTLNNVSWQFKSAAFTEALGLIIFVTLSGFINELFSKRKLRFKIIFFVSVLALLMNFFKIEPYSDLIVALIIFLLLEAIFVVVGAIRRKVKGAWIIGTGILFFTIFILSGVIISLTYDSEMLIDNSSMVGMIIITCAILTIISIPLSMSIYLAWNFSSINKNLSMQLEQVKLLSQKNIEQEQEKQRILENRKAFLEAEVLERTSELREEKKKSDDLLLNILPAEIAEELKEKGSAKARDYEQVTVMFTDFKDFTKISELLTPAELVKEIDLCFSAFDHIIQKHGIEKIKTIGDAYMCVGGLPVPSNTHAIDVINAAIEMRDFMEKHNHEKAMNGEHQFKIRIGIHTGSVVAGIVGIKKFAYDIWGDTVNIASRIESSGEPGKINISGSTYEIIKDQFNCSYRGKIEAKNKGEIDMYFVENS